MGRVLGNSLRVNFTTDMLILRGKNPHIAFAFKRGFIFFIFYDMVIKSIVSSKKHVKNKIMAKLVQK